MVKSQDLKKNLFLSVKNEYELEQIGNVFWFRSTSVIDDALDFVPIKIVNGRVGASG
jgi:hypothetical protein